MTIGLGLIGAGAIGQAHAIRINTRIRGATVVAAQDADKARVDDLTLKLPGIQIHQNVADLIRDPSVDAVLIASPATAHAEHVLEVLRAGKYVFCEKPLATTAADCLRIIRLEVESNRRMLQLGFMRRFDEGYLALKRMIDSKTYGEVLMIHAAHRNAKLPTSFQNSMAVTDCLIHELDVMRWLTGDEYASARVIYPRRTRHAPPHLQDPQIFLLEGRRGTTFDVEVTMNAQYAYDIRCEIVCEDGVFSLPRLARPALSAEGIVGQLLCQDWQDRFDPSFTVELQSFVDAVALEQLSGPSSWDGYVAACAADACVKGQASRTCEAITEAQVPELYR